jgi:DNA repair protein RecO (recombination protein O)
LATLRDLGKPDVPTGPRLAHFELVLLRELGYSPTLTSCAACGEPLAAAQPAFSAAAGGMLCRNCQPRFRDRVPLAPESWEALKALTEPGEPWQRGWSQAARAEVRRALGQYVTYLLGRRPRLLPYLGS